MSSLQQEYPASLGNFLEMQNFRSHIRLTKAKALGIGPDNVCFNKPSSRSRCTLVFESDCPRERERLFLAFHSTSGLSLAK